MNHTPWILIIMFAPCMTLTDEIPTKRTRAGKSTFLN